MAMPMEQPYKKRCVCGLPCQKGRSDTKSAGACVLPAEEVYLRKLSNGIAAQVQVLQVSKAAYDAREACHSIVGA